MAVTRIALAPDEDIIRVFLRWPNESWGFAKLRKKDFARQMGNHSGMSMLRLKYLDDRQEALDWFESEKLKGLAICKAKALIDLGLHFMASSETDKHISVRCPPCNLEVNYPTLCKSASGDQCLIDLEAANTLSTQLYKLFQVDTAVVDRN